MPRDPIDADTIVAAIDAQIMGLIALKGIVLGVAYQEQVTLGESAVEGPCPDHGGEPHDVIWTQDFNDPDQHGMCRFCARQWALHAGEAVGVSDPE